MPAIQLNHKLCLCAKKVHNKIADCLLTLEPNRVCGKIIIPKMLFLPCHIFPQFFCAWDQLFIVLK